MKFLLVLVCLVALTTGSTISGRVVPKPKPLQRLSPVNGRITGGTAVPNIESRPFQVGLILDDDYLCGGSLISSQWILTAAHCVQGVSSIETFMGLNLDNTATTQIIARNSTNVYVHENYTSITNNDIAVIKLNTPLNITSTSNEQIISLPPATTPVNSYEGVTAKASGWGRTSTTSTPIYLQWVDLIVISNTDCSDVFGPLPASILCTQTTQPKSTCNGDSGGPLTYNNTVIGVVSFGSSAGCELGYPNGFVRVTSFLTWINQKTGIPIPV